MYRGRTWTFMCEWREIPTQEVIGMIQNDAFFQMSGGPQQTIHHYFPEEQIFRLYLGCTVVVQRKFEPGEFLALVERENVTTTLLIPTMLNMVMHHSDFDRYNLGDLRLIFYGGGPMPVPLLKQAIERTGCGFTQGYGLGLRDKTSFGLYSGWV
jgi:acyl-coenzyme A synthetase/AMP-(fatty) acid ligase